MDFSKKINPNSPPVIPTKFPPSAITCKSDCDVVPAVQSVSSLISDHLTVDRPKVPVAKLPVTTKSLTTVICFAVGEVATSAHNVDVPIVQYWIIAVPLQAKTVFPN